MIIDVNTMRNILDRIPGDFEIEFREDDKIYPISDKIEIDITGKKIILKS